MIRPFHGYHYFVSLTLEFDTFFEIFNLTVSARALIFHMSVPCDKTFPWVPLFFTLFDPILVPPLKKGDILFCNCRSVGGSVGMSVCRSVDQVLSAQYLLTPSLDQYQTWCRGAALNK